MKIVDLFFPSLGNNTAGPEWWIRQSRIVTAKIHKHSVIDFIHYAISLNWRNLRPPAAWWMTMCLLTLMAGSGGIIKGAAMLAAWWLFWIIMIFLALTNSYARNKRTAMAQRNIAMGNLSNSVKQFRPEGKPISPDKMASPEMIDAIGRWKKMDM